MDRELAYQHTQKAPLCLLVYGLALTFLVLAFVLRHETVIVWGFPPAGLLLLALAVSFHHLTVADESDRLSIRFGPLPLFRKNVRSENILAAEVGRTTILDGWGIHMSLRGGSVWNLLGRDCVILRLRRGINRVGTDDADNLARSLETRIRPLRVTRRDRDMNLVRRSAALFDSTDLMPDSIKWQPQRHMIRKEAHSCQQRIASNLASWCRSV